MRHVRSRFKKLCGPIEQLRRNQYGSSLVEAALVSILLLLLMAGVADIGRAFYTYIALTNAAQEGARYAAHIPDNMKGIRDAVKEEAAGNNIILADEQIRVIPNPLWMPPAPGSPIRVEVEYDLPTILGDILGLDNLHMRSSAVMIVLNPGR